jgi:hypothetical protein
MLFSNMAASKTYPTHNSLSWQQENPSNRGNPFFCILKNIMKWSVKILTYFT